MSPLDVPGYLTDGAGSAWLETHPDGLLVIDQSGQILLFNRRVEQIFGLAPGELLGSSIESLLPDRFHEAHRSLRDEIFDDAPSESFEPVSMFGLRSSGEEFPVELGLTPVDTPHGRRLVAVVQVAEHSVRGRSATQYASVVLERQRIACALNERVIRPLFAVSMALKSLQTQLDDPALVSRIDALCAELDASVAGVRNAVYEPDEWC